MDQRGDHGATRPGYRGSVLAPRSEPGPPGHNEFFYSGSWIRPHSWRSHTHFQVWRLPVNWEEMCTNGHMQPGQSRADVEDTLVDEQYGTRFSKNSSESIPRPFECVAVLVSFFWQRPPELLYPHGGIILYGRTYNNLFGILIYDQTLPDTVFRILRFADTF